jgi:hypothetical protein
MIAVIFMFKPSSTFTFNPIDFHAALTGAKVRKVRKIKSFEKDLKVNKELFKLATALV